MSLWQRFTGALGAARAAQMQREFAQQFPQRCVVCSFERDARKRGVVVDEHKHECGQPKVTKETKES